MSKEQDILTTRTATLRGAFNTDFNLRQEFYSLID